MATWADTPGTKPGTDRAISQHKGMAMGMAAPASKRSVKTLQKSSSTGCTKAPGLTNR